MHAIRGMRQILTQGYCMQENCILSLKSLKSQEQNTPGVEGGGYSKSRPNLRPKNAISHTRFQTWPQKSIPVFRPDLVHD